MKMTIGHIMVHLLLATITIAGAFWGNVLFMSVGLLGGVFFILGKQFRYEIEKSILKKNHEIDKSVKGEVISFFDKRKETIRSLFLSEEKGEFIDFYVADITKKMKVKKLDILLNPSDQLSVERIHHYVFQYLRSVKVHSMFLLQNSILLPLLLFFGFDFSGWVFVIPLFVVLFIIFVYYEEFFQINRFEAFMGDDLTLDYQEEANKIKIITKLFADNVFKTQEPIMEHILISGELVLERNNEFYLLSIDDQSAIYGMFSELVKRESKKRQ